MVFKTRYQGYHVNQKENSFLAVRTGKRQLLAFAHIAKTGGTSLNHFLRRQFFLRCADVRPLTPGSQGVFFASDLKKMLMLNPALQCVIGHSVRPLSDLESVISNLRYFTILRHQVDRSISHHQQRVSKYGHISMEGFLERDWVWNFQTKALAGSDDLEQAKKVIADRITTVGTLEEID